MSRYTVVVDRLSDWKWPQDGVTPMPVDEFLADGIELPPGHRIVNLCRRYSYLSAGYYCSLLAEARGQTPMPTVADVLCLSKKSLYAFALPELDEALNRTMRRLKTEPEAPFGLVVFFGEAEDSRFKRLGTLSFDIFRYPILRLQIVKDTRWRVAGISALGLHQLPAELGERFLDALRSYTRARRSLGGGRLPSLYRLAILHEPGEKLPPSDRAALDRFVRAGQPLRMDVDLIAEKDFRRLPEYDGLFIRTTTSIDHYTYQFALRARQEGLAVIDDPVSILRCTNKVFLHEILRLNGVPKPKSETVNRLDFDERALPALEDRLGYPIVLKIPDGSFSRGIHKAENRDELFKFASELLSHSRLILAQEYVYTEFDWRVGVLAGKPLYVCRYLMSRNHWQILQHGPNGTVREGGFETIPVEAAPLGLIEVATRAAALMGDGLYGVDVKETPRGFLVIEVNDNPSIDHGVEDKVLQERLYDSILRDFIRRIDEAA